MRYFLQELQENTQLCNLVGEISHAIGHCYHNLSDLMIDLNQPRPRHLYAAFVSPPVQTTLIHQQTIPVHINAVSELNYRFCFPTADLKKWRHSTVFRNFIQCMYNCLLWILQSPRPRRPNQPMPTTTSTSTSTPTPPTNTSGSQVLKTFSDIDIQHLDTCAFTVMSHLVHVYF